MALLALGALLAGFVAGLTGFGTSMTAMAFWLYVVPPVIAAPLAAICAVAAHILSARKIFHTFNFNAAKPFLIGGFVGVPLGIGLLTIVSAIAFKGGLGLFLAAYAGLMLLMKEPPVISWGGKLADGAVGLIGGFLGGFSGLSGPIPALWCMLRGWDKASQRSVIQGFNMLILTFAICIFVFKGLITREVLSAVVVCIPATLIGSWFGTNAFLAIDAGLFRKVVLGLVCVSGAVLTTTWIWG
ncbi:MAG: sulfite exporter TauE/SafE family protein [Hyphomicrobiales bacterium]